MPTPWDDFLTHTATIYKFTPSQDADAGETNPCPSAPYAVAEPCYVEPEGTQDVYDTQDRITQINTFTVFFARRLAFTLRDKIVWTDADGTPGGTLYFTGANDMTRVPIGGLVEATAIERL